MTETTRLTPPPGYGPIALLDRSRHAGLGIRPDLDFAWAKSLNLAFLTSAELARAALDYPIAFVRDTVGGDLVPVAIFGVRTQQNLFVDGAGQWRQLAYVPAYLRRYPFCVAQATGGPAGAEAQSLICVQEDQLVPSSKPLFNAQGEAADAWHPIRDLVEAAEAARQRTLKLVQEINALGLIIPFAPISFPNTSAQLRLDGLYQIDPSGFDALSIDQLSALRGDALRAIYAHLLSLGNFSKLLELAVVRESVAWPSP